MTTTYSYIHLNNYMQLSTIYFLLYPRFYVTLRYVNRELAGGSLLFRYAHCEMLSRAKLRGTRMVCSMGVLSLTPPPPLTHAPRVKQLTVPPTRDYCTHSYWTRSSAYVQPAFPFRVVHFRMPATVRTYRTCNSK